MWRWKAAIAPNVVRVDAGHGVARPCAAFWHDRTHGVVHEFPVYGIERPVVPHDGVTRAHKLQRQPLKVLLGAGHLLHGTQAVLVACAARLGELPAAAGPRAARAASRTAAPEARPPFASSLTPAVVVAHAPGHTRGTANSPIGSVL